MFEIGTPVRDGFSNTGTVDEVIHKSNTEREYFVRWDTPFYLQSGRTFISVRYAEWQLRPISPAEQANLEAEKVRLEKVEQRQQTLDTVYRYGMYAFLALTLVWASLILARLFLY